MRRRRSSSTNLHNVRNVRAVVLGQDGVGKSALTVRFITRRFISEYDKKLEATYRHHLTVEGQYISLDIMDTAGKNTKGKIETLLTNTNIIYLLYSTTRRASFDEARWLAKQIQHSKAFTPSHCLIIVVATKCDLKHLRQVLEYEGRFLAQELDAQFYQISISEGYEETQEVLLEGIKCWINKDVERGRSSTLLRVKEGLKGTAKSFRKKSSMDNLFADTRSLPYTTL